MKLFILITAIIELLAGAGLFIAPDILPDLQGEGTVSLTFARMYGGAALALGYYALMVWQNFGPGPVQGFLKTFLVFHIAVTVATFVGYRQGVSSFINVAVLHGLLALITLYFLAKAGSVRSE